MLFRNAFNDFDKNSDGLLSRAEFHNVFKQSGKEYTDKQINLYVILKKSLNKLILFAFYVIFNL